MGQDAKGDPLSAEIGNADCQSPEDSTYQVKLHGVKAVRNSLTTTGHEINAVTETHLEVAANREEDRYVLIAQTESLFPGLSYRPAAPVAALSDVYLINQKNGSTLVRQSISNY